MNNTKKDELHKSDFNSKTTIFIEYLQNRGHPESTIQAYKKSVLHFYQWSEKSKFRNQIICKEIIDNFLYRHLPVCTCSKPTRKSLNTVRAALHLFYFCIEGKKKIGFEQNINCSSVDLEVSSYSSYLKDICGFSNSTCIYRIRNVRNFLHTVFRKKPFTVESIRKTDFFHYISTHARHCTNGTKNVIACSLRSYLKYLQFKGHVKADFVRIVPSVPNWNLASIPSIFSTDQIKRFLNSFDFTTPAGVRDYAMALCMTDLGLRASEVAKIELHDIDWQQSILHIKSTKSRHDRNLPIPNRLGKAIVQYIKNGRLSTNTINLFVRHTVPYGIALNTEQVRGAMRRSYARAGFSNSITGTHILRHTAASRMHQNGATIKQLADVLGHQSIDTTIFYTKINLPLLKNVSLPWPEVKR